MDAAGDSPLLESLARDSQMPLHAVASLYELERAALALNARITSYIPVLAARRVRHQLQRKRDLFRDH
jgi:hypothetical protein